MLVALVLASVLGTPGFDVKTWRSEDGLPSDAVIALAQTPDGYLWVGTNAGLARFDGVRFTVFDRSTTPELSSDQCGPLFVDAAGALWIGTMGGGFTRYADGTFTPFGRKEGSTFEYIMSIFPDRKGRLWLGTNDRLHLWDGSRFKAFGPEDGVDIPRPFPFLEDAAGRIWINGVDGRLAFLEDDVGHAASYDQPFLPPHVRAPVRATAGPDGAHWIVSSTETPLTRWANGVARPFELSRHGREDGIGRVVPLENGDVWVGLRQSGLRLLRGDRVIAIGTKEGLPTGSVAAFLADHEGNIWAGTSGGLTRIKPKTFAALHDAGGLEVERTWAVFEDRQGAVWFGTDGVLWRLAEGRIARFGMQDGLPLVGVTSFAEDAKGDLWIGCSGGLTRFSGEKLVAPLTRDALPSANVRSLYTDRRGRLWIGTTGGVAVMEGDRLRTYTTADGLAGNWVRFVYEDSKGSMWLATTSGLSRLENGTFTTFTAKDGLADDRVMAIEEDDTGALWLGTYRGGLTRYKAGRFASINKANGLHDDLILRILPDDAGNFWMSTPKGVFRVARKELDDVADGRSRTVTSIAYGKPDGLPTIDCGGGTQPAGWRTRDGRLWFPTGRGVAVVDPAVVRNNTVPPPVHIEEVLYDRVHPGGRRQAMLPPGTKSLEIHYTATALGEPDRARFRYKLEPFDRDWVDAGGRRVAYYTALRPGRYTFHVTAANESGVWNEAGAVYDLRVKPHLYETPPFYAACAALVVLTGWGAYRVRVRQIEARYAAVLSERGRIARELHDTIAQGFTGVSMQLEAASAKLGHVPESARDNLDRARLLVRSSLNDARRSVRALRPHLLESGDLAASLRATAAQLTAGTDVGAEVVVHGLRRRLPPETEDALFRLAQEAMTNALRHGAARHLRIELRVAKGEAALTIADDGLGFDPSAGSKGSGLAGMNERVARLGGSVVVDSAPGAGTKVTAILPLRRKASEETA